MGAEVLSASLCPGACVRAGYDGVGERGFLRTQASLCRRPARLTQRLALARGARGHRSPQRPMRRAATADPAETETMEEPTQASPTEEELPSPQAAAEEEAEAAAEASTQAILAALKAAVESGEDGALAEVEAQVKALGADRDSLVATLGSLEQEVSKAKDRYLRLNADFDNFRKRTEREKQSLASLVKGDVLEALLPMVDSFERAKTSLKLETEGEQRIDNSYQGIYKQFVEIMKGFGVAAVETVGKEFNPEVHEAIMREESGEFADGVVSLEFRKGFVIGDKLVRPAMVKVSTGPGPGSEEGSEVEGSDVEGSSEE